MNKDNYIAIELYINNKEMFDFLFEIEKKIGKQFEWWRFDNKKASKILSYINELDFNKISKK